MSESAVRDKPLLVYGLARNRRSPKRPAEPRPSGAHPEEDAVKRRCGATVSWGVGRVGRLRSKDGGRYRGRVPNWPDEVDQFAQIASDLQNLRDRRWRPESCCGSIIMGYV